MQTMGKSFMFANPASHRELSPRYNTRNRRSWRSVDCIDENFLTQVICNVMTESTLVEPGKKADVMKEKVDGSLGCCDHMMVKFRDPERRKQGI